VAVPDRAHAVASTKPEPGPSGAHGKFGAQIVNGVSSTLARYPYIAEILMTNQSITYFAQFCDGAVVAPTLVLSAAHCTFDENGTALAASDVDVLVGADDLSTNSGTPEGRRIAVTQIIRNPGYNALTTVHDLALFVLASPAGVPPVTVIPPSSNFRFAGGREAHVAGFGCSQFDADPGECTQYPTHLRETAISMLSDRQCENFGGIYARHLDPPTMVCAGSGGTIRQIPPDIQQGDARSPCFGDSGGPLVVPSGSSSPYEVGVVSWGPSACGTGPGVFSRLAAPDHIAWLQANGVPVPRAPFSAGPALRVSGNFTPVTGDFNGDGTSDVLWFNPSGSDYLWFGGAGGFTAAPLPAWHVSMNGALRPVAGDFNGDGATDILWYGPGPAADRLWLGSSGGFTNGPAVSVNRYAIPVVGDFNGDGKDDIYWYGPGHTSDALYLGKAVGFRGAATLANNGSFVPVPGDFNGDGATDIVWYGADSAPDALWRGGAGGFTGGGGFSVAGRYVPIAGDFDGDHRADVLWWSSTGDDVLRRGSATSFVGAPDVVVNGAYVPVTGDFNGDHRADILFYGPGSAPDRVLLGTHR
jgi:secreted trypsin-like serine protease